jgi:threonine/homoserine/homoserine lactone efflux protein
MSLELAGALSLFAAVTLFTPGPNNVMLMASGLNFGFRRTLPHLSGVVIGFGFMVLLVGLGLGTIFTALPWLYPALKIVAAVYLVYLAWKIANASAIEEKRRSSPMTFWQASAFQWVNPKAWIMAIGAVTSYAAVAAFPLNAAVASAIFTVIGVVSAFVWLTFGTGLRRVITDQKVVRIFNYVMALLLVLSLVPVFLSS